MKRLSFTALLLVMALLIPANRVINAQQLVQSFVQANIEETDMEFGRSITSAGDVNDDNINDIIVGALGYSNDIGRAYIYYGGTSMDNSADVIIDGENAGDYFGCSVSSAGDINNDGYDDVIIGAYGYSSFTGRAYIFYGGSLSSSIDASSANVIITGENGNDKFGKSVFYAGDVNNDNINDIIVGGYVYSSYTGRAYIFYGSNSLSTDIDAADADVIITGENTYTSFGASAASGDVNGDNVDDIIVGAFAYSNTTGRAYVFYGGSLSSSINASSADVIITGENENDFFGYRVASGDVNGDNVDDIVVGAIYYSNITGRAYIFYGGSLSSSINASSADVIITGENEGDYFGWSVFSAGDVNNDNIGDVIVAASAYTSSNMGHVYIFYGGSLSSSINASSADVIITGENGDDDFGFRVASTDVNNDNIDDVIVGAVNYSSYTGRAYIIYGNSSLATTINAADADVIFDPPFEGNYFGCSVSSAGDVNDDEIDDIIVGAMGYSGNTGRVYIFYGGSSMDETADVTITGENEDDDFGFLVSNAGDVNNDNIDDIIIGAKGYSSETGQAYIFYGNSSLSSTINASSADVVITGENEGDCFGESVSFAGDVNGDTVDDVIIGASQYSGSTGRSYIIYGNSSLSSTFNASSANVIITGENSSDKFGSSVSTAGDVNDDNIDDIFVSAYRYSNSTGRAYVFYGNSSLSSTLNASSADVVITGENEDDEFGRSVSNAGDVNNDNTDDIIIGACKYSSSTGRAYIYYGSENMDNTPDITIDGENAGDYFGCSVSYAGDINNDGYDDVIVGAEEYSSSTGRAYIYYGNENMDNTADIIIDGESGDHFGVSVSCAGDVNNDGFDDFIIGADYSGSVNNGKAHIYSDDSAPMPVELTSFTASVLDDAVALAWQTATEVNNYGFEIERSVGQTLSLSRNWETLSFLPGHGNSNSPKSYEFIDEQPPAGNLEYRLKQIDTDGSYEYYSMTATITNSVTNVESGKVIPQEYSLAQNYPNPFNPTTTINYAIPTVDQAAGLTGNVTLKVYDILGGEVATLVNKKQSPGNYSVEFNAGNQPSGIYVYKITAGEFVQSRKMLLIK